MRLFDYIIIILFIICFSCNIIINTNDNIKEYYSPDVPKPKHMKKCTPDKLSNNKKKCIRERITDKYNLNNIRGSQGMYVNIDGQELYDNTKVSKKWKKKGCGTHKNFSVFNQPEKYLDKEKVEFSHKLAENNRVYNSFKINCPDKQGSVNDYYTQLQKQKENERKMTKERNNKNNKLQKETDFNINGIDYATAEQYYKQNYGYDIAPLNTTNFWLPSNYIQYSEYNRPTLDKKIVDSKIPEKDKYRTRAFNWQFGKN
jgi:hypothetical protein